MSMFSSDTANSMVTELMSPEVVETLMTVMRKVNELMDDGEKAGTDEMDWNLLKERIISVEAVDRAEAIEHLTSLLENASHNVIYDNSTHNMVR